MPWIVTLSLTQADTVTNDILTRNRGSQSGEPNSGVARKLRGRKTSQYIFFARSWRCCKILNGFAMAATSGMQTPHQIVSEMLKDQTAREMLQEFFGDMMAAQVRA